MTAKVANSQDMHTLECKLYFNHEQSRKELYAY